MTLRCANFLKPLVIGPHVSQNRAQIESDAEGNCIESVVNAAGIGHLYHQHFGWLNATPKRKSVVAHQIRRAHRNMRSLKHALMTASPAFGSGSLRGGCSLKDDDPIICVHFLPAESVVAITTNLPLWQTFDRIKSGKGDYNPVFTFPIGASAM